MKKKGKKVDSGKENEEFRLESQSLGILNDIAFEMILKGGRFWKKTEENSGEKK